MGEILAYMVIFMMWISSFFGYPDLYEVKTYKMGSHTLYIPYTYSYHGVGIPNDDGAILAAYYPGNAPMPAESYGELMDPRLDYKRLTINIKLLQNIRKDYLERSYNNFKKSARATHLVKNIYGLDHYSQAPEDKKTLGLADIYVLKNDQGKVEVFFYCYKDASRPSCNVSFNHGDYAYLLRMHMKLLPEWQKIKSSTIKLMHSFNSKNSAIENINQFLPEENKIRGDK